MRFLAAFIVALFIVLYSWLIKLIIAPLPLWLSLLVVTIALTIFIHVTTEVGRK